MICLNYSIEKILESISEEYRNESGISNTMKFDIDGEEIIRHPIVNSDDDLFVIKNDLYKYILQDKKFKILLIVNAYKKNGRGMCKVIMVHHVANGKESIYFAKCKKNKNEKFLGKFTKMDIDEFSGLFGDLYNTNSHKEAI